MFKETIINEPAPGENLYMETAYRGDDEEKRMVSIGVIEKDSAGEYGTISFQIVTFKKGWSCQVATVDLTRTEIDEVIKALQQAKERMVQNA